MLQTVLTLALSAAVGYVLYRKHIPAGMLIGAVIASAVLTAVFHAGHIPGTAKNIAQVIAGTFIGCSARREDFRQLRTFWKPVLMITFSLLVVNLAIGFLLCLVGYSDLLTCLVCAIPGGIAETTLIAADFGADPSKVLLVHFCRLISTAHAHGNSNLAANLCSNLAADSIICTLLTFNICPFRMS